MSPEMEQLIKEKIQYVVNHQEEIITAFVAKYKCQPEDIVCVNWRKDNFTNEWFIKTKSDDHHYLSGKSDGIEEGIKVCKHEIVDLIDEMVLERHSLSKTLYSDDIKNEILVLRCLKMKIRNKYSK